MNEFKQIQYIKYCKFYSFAKQCSAIGKPNITTIRYISTDI